MDFFIFLFFFFCATMPFCNSCPRKHCTFFVRMQNMQALCEFKNCETDFYAEQNSERSSSCLMALSTVTLGQYISH